MNALPSYRGPCAPLPTASGCGTAGYRSPPFDLRRSVHITQKRRVEVGAEAGGVTETDRQYIRQALSLARRGLGKTEPNPAVGCVIVKDDKVIGEGFHPKAGEPHAEVFALRGAGQEAEGATAYVTLEPCNHYGQTPPCSKALVAARVARVVVGVGDPNPLVGGAGLRTLEAAGVTVAMIGGTEEQECYDLNEDFMEKMKASM